MVQGKQVPDSASIAREFQHFYYIQLTSPLESSTAFIEQVRAYLQKSALPRLTEDMLSELKWPITSEEVGKAIANLPPGKSPGPDCFTKYYKTLFSTLVYPMCTYFNHITSDNPLPKDAPMAHITVLPKPGRNPQYCTNY